MLRGIEVKPSSWSAASRRCRSVPPSPFAHFCGSGRVAFFLGV